MAITGDINQTTQTVTVDPSTSLNIANTHYSGRWWSFNIEEKTGADLSDGEITLTDEGSYTYIFYMGSDIRHRGKIMVYDGTLEKETIFGDEVTYTEHSNTYTNTQYITI